MRFDTPIYFQTVRNEYDASTGDYGEDIVTEEMRYASVTNTGDDALTLVYGVLKQDSVTVRLQNHYDKPFDRVRIGNKYYRVDKARKLRTKHTFIMSEVQ